MHAGVCSFCWSVQRQCKTWRFLTAVELYHAPNCSSYMPFPLHVGLTCPIHWLSNFLAFPEKILRCSKIHRCQVLCQPQIDSLLRFLKGLKKLNRINLNNSICKVLQCHTCGCIWMELGQQIGRGNCTWPWMPHRNWRELCVWSLRYLSSTHALVTRIRQQRTLTSNHLRNASGRAGFCFFLGNYQKPELPFVFCCW